MLDPIRNKIAGFKQEFVKFVTEPKNFFRTYNGAVATLVTVGYVAEILQGRYTRFSEYGVDILIHAVEATCVKVDSDTRVKLLAAAVNLARLGQIGFYLVGPGIGLSTIPLVLNVLDIFNHGLNLASLPQASSEKIISLVSRAPCFKVKGG